MRPKRATGSWVGGLILALLLALAQVSITASGSQVAMHLPAAMLRRQDCLGWLRGACGEEETQDWCLGGQCMQLSCGSSWLRRAGRQYDSANQGKEQALRLSGGSSCQGQASGVRKGRGPGEIQALIGGSSSLRGALWEERGQEKGRRQPGPGDAVVRRKVLDEKRNVWNMIPLETWPRAVQGIGVVETVPEAVEDCLEGVSQRVFVGAGSHVWGDNKLVVGGWRADEEFPWEGSYPRGYISVQFNLTGEAQARMWGMWVLEPGSAGSFEGVTLAYHSEEPGRPTVEVWEGPWVFETCDLRSTCGTALWAGKIGKVSCLACGIGGLDGGEKDEFGDWIVQSEYVSGHPQRAYFGLKQSELSEVVMWQCTVEFTGLGAAGIYIIGESTLLAGQCEFYGNSVAIMLSEASSIVVSAVTPKCSGSIGSRPERTQHKGMRSR